MYTLERIPARGGLSLEQLKLLHKIASIAVDIAAKEGPQSNFEAAVLYKEQVTDLLVAALQNAGAGS